MIEPAILDTLQRGTVLPAHPLALDAKRQLDERCQRALSRYYIAAGAGGLAIGVHTTQFAIRDPKVGLYQPVLAIAAEEMNRADTLRTNKLLRIAGVCGDTKQAVREARIAADLGYHAGLLNLSAMGHADEDALIAHCRAVSDVVAVFGFYVQAGIGGCVLPYAFWRRFAEIDHVIAIKIAAFNRYQTIDVVRAIADSGRNDVALYTGNDDTIVFDLLTPYRFSAGDKIVERHMVGGLLGHWAVSTRSAVAIHRQCRQLAAANADVASDLLAVAMQVTDANAAFFDPAHQFAGCIPGILEVLRRQGLVQGIWCLDPAERLSPGQSEEIDRVLAAYPQLCDDTFVQEHRDAWLAG